jgi:hypothetical protein
MSAAQSVLAVWHRLRLPSTTRGYTCLADRLTDRTSSRARRRARARWRRSNTAMSAQACSVRTTWRPRPSPRAAWRTTPPTSPRRAGWCGRFRMNSARSTSSSSSTGIRRLRRPARTDDRAVARGLRVPAAGDDCAGPGRGAADGRPRLGPRRQRLLVRRRRPGAAPHLSSSHRAAQLAALKTIAGQVAADVVTINSVLPGRIAIDRLVENFGSPDAASEVPRTDTPAGLLGTIEELAGAVAFLCSARASYITGTTPLVDGGLSRAMGCAERLPTLMLPDLHAQAVPSANQPRSASSTPSVSRRAPATESRPGCARSTWDLHRSLRRSALRRPRGSRCAASSPRRSPRRPS